jgi:hypothetical protein
MDRRGPWGRSREPANSDWADERDRRADEGRGVGRLIAGPVMLPRAAGALNPVAGYPSRLGGFSNGATST